MVGVCRFGSVNCADMLWDVCKVQAFLGMALVNTDQVLLLSPNGAIGWCMTSRYTYMRHKM